jgi:hypothetical protein
MALGSQMGRANIRRSQSVVRRIRRLKLQVRPISVGEQRWFMAALSTSRQARIEACHALRPAGWCAAGHLSRRSGWLRASRWSTGLAAGVYEDQRVGAQSYVRQDVDRAA